MQRFMLPAFSFLFGIIVALVIAVALVLYGSSLMDRPNSAGRVRDSAPQGSMPVVGGPGPVSTQYTRGWELLSASRPKEAQDVFLEILSTDPGDRHAMQGLVAARRAIVGNDPRELRRQAALYQDAMMRGTDLGDHYTPVAMGALVTSSEQAAEEIEARSDPAPIAPSDVPQTPGNRTQSPSPKDKIPPSRKLPPSTHTATPPTPVRSPAPKNAMDTRPAAPAVRNTPPPPTATPQPPAPPPAAAPQHPTPPAPPPPTAATPQLAPPPSGNARFYVVRAGPISNRDQASALEKELSGKGFSPAKVLMQAGMVFRVVSEPLPRSVAENLAATLAERGLRSHVEPPTGDTTHLVFGVFTSQSEAEDLVRRINAQGYDAWVTREGTAYTIVLGPYPQSSVDTITAIIKSSAPETAVVADPVP